MCNANFPYEGKIVYYVMRILHTNFHPYVICDSFVV